MLETPITIEDEGTGELDMYPVARDASGREFYLEKVAKEFNKMAVCMRKMETEIKTLKENIKRLRESATKMKAQIERSQ